MSKRALKPVKTGQEAGPHRRMRGFEPAGRLLGDSLRAAGETRGFAVSRLLTHWDEVVGSDIAAIARPVNIAYGKVAFGPTLTLLTSGANAPVLQMQLPKIREKVNACYGYNAISAIRITQTAASGFADGQTPFSAEKSGRSPAFSSETDQAACDLAGLVADSDLRRALEGLARNVLSRQGIQRG